MHTDRELIEFNRRVYYVDKGKGSHVLRANPKKI